jgi:hypothetical protein
VPEVSGLRRDETATYCICVAGVIDARWSAVFGNMQISTEVGDEQLFVTTLRGTVADQAALMGVLNLTYDLGMVLLSVEYQSSP